MQVPGRPGTPSIDETDATKMEVTWSAPPYDGGISRDGYIVEYQEAETSLWKRCRELVSDTLFTLTNLNEYQRYQVRVKALYGGCHGPTSIPSLPNVTKPKIGGC